MGRSDGDSFELPILRPRIGGRGGAIAPERVPRLKSSVLARVERVGQRAHDRFAKQPAARRGPRTIPVARDVRAPSGGARRCVVKARYVRMNAYGKKAAALHLRYIERDGVERDGSKGQLFGPDASFEREKFAEALDGERRQWRFIVAPEDGAELDLRDYTRRLMAQMESDLGRRLEWAAVTHYNTDNPHVHVVIRGIDRDGDELRIDPKYVAHGLRSRAQEIATFELGPRSEYEVERQLVREVAQERLTSLDRKLGELAGPDRTVDFLRLRAEGDGRVGREGLLGRLETLEQLHLAQRVSPTSWQLVEGWQESLKALGERGDVIKRLHASMGAADASKVRVLDASSDATSVEGIVRRKGLHDELGEELFAVVESASGHAHYVRLDRVTAEHVQEGDVVRVSAQKDAWAKPMDRVLESVAALGGGVYDPDAHRAQLERDGVRASGRSVAPADVVAANLRRLERLQRHGIDGVGRRADGKWTVPPNLVERLQARDQAQPRRRLAVEPMPLRKLEAQARHHGPTWLDSLDASKARATYGFGAELSRALATRQAFLRANGIDPTSPTRLERLAELERERVGAAMATTRGMRHESPAPGFRGRLFACEPAPSGQKLAVIVDEASGRLVVVPAPQNARNLEGRQVETSLDRDGRLGVRAAGLSRGA